MSFLQYLQDLDISQWIATSDWGYPIMLAIHSIGLAMAVGVAVMIDLRVLGFAKNVPLSGFSRLVRYAWAGFIINAASGVLLFMSDAVLLSVNWPFWLKMANVVIGAVTLMLLTRDLRFGEFYVLNGEAVLAQPVVTSRARVLAIVSMCAWMAAIDSGRLIAYVVDSAVLNH